jgi:hypothetical protein
VIQATLQRRPTPPPTLDLADMAKQALQPWADAYETWRSGAVDLLERTQTASRPKPKSGCGCAKCDPDPCACRCCITDSDLVLEARVGERRMVTLIIENHWRRARDINLDLSTWSKTTDGAEVTAEILTPTKFTLAPCGEAQVTLAIEIGAAPSLNGQDGAADQRRLTDVGQCVVSYADLRIQGCDMRSLRLAVAVLPRDCDAHKVDCACGCC